MGPSTLVAGRGVSDVATASSPPQATIAPMTDIGSIINGMGMVYCGGPMVTNSKVNGWHIGSMDMAYLSPLRTSISTEIGKMESGTGEATVASKMDQRTAVGVTQDGSSYCGGYSSRWVKLLRWV